MEETLDERYCWGPDDVVYLDADGNPVTIEEWLEMDITTGS